MYEEDDTADDLAPELAEARPAWAVTYDADLSADGRRPAVNWTAETMSFGDVHVDISQHAELFEGSVLSENVDIVVWFGGNDGVTFATPQEIRAASEALAAAADRAASILEVQK